MSPKKDHIEIRIVGTDLPGIQLGDYGPVYVGIQRARSAIQLVPGSAEQAVFTAEVHAVFKYDGITHTHSVDFKGPFVQGRPGERFIYLSWGEVAGAAGFDMFRRAKIILGQIDPKLALEVFEDGGVLQATLGMSDHERLPVCGSISESDITWTRES